MKLSILAATAALLMSTAAQAENLTTLHKGTHWQVLQHARNSNSNPMCTMQALMGWKNKAQGAVMVKYAPNAGVFFHVVKSQLEIAGRRQGPAHCHTLMIGPRTVGAPRLPSSSLREAKPVICFPSVLLTMRPLCS